MFLSYIATAFRVLKQQKIHTALNILGFSIGIAATILVALFAQHQLTIDKHQADAERVYRIHQDMRSVGLQVDGAINPKMPLLMRDHAQIEDMLLIANSFFLQFSGHPFADVVTVEDQQFRLRNFYIATENLPEFADINVMYGDLNRTLQQQGLIALSKSEAMRLFGRNNVVGESLNYDGGKYQIAAVFDDLGNNTHFSFDVLAKMPKVEQGPFGSHVYVKLMEGANAAALAQEMTNEQVKRANNPNFSDVSFVFIPLTELHFNTSGQWEMKQGGSYLALQVSLALSVLLLIIASVNFINFNIAGAAKRAKEVGVRKSLGASKWQLVSQFLMESLLLVLLAGVIAFALVELSLPAFNILTESQLWFDYRSAFMLGVISMFIIIGVLAGLYPALFISSFSAKRVLSGDLSRGKSSAYIRKLTLCIQGVVAISLIAAVVMVYQQMVLVNSTDVGYEKENRLVIRELPSALLFNKYSNALLDELAGLNGIENITLSDTDYATDMNGGMHYTWPNGETYDGMFPSIRVGFDVVETLGLKLLAGRGFKRDFSSDWYHSNDDSSAEFGIIITKQKALMAGYDNLEEVIGVKVTVPRRNFTATVVGVVDDIRLGSVNKPELPTSFILGFADTDIANIVLKTDGKQADALIKQVNAVLQKHLQRNDIELRWLIDEFMASHKHEQKTLNILAVFSPLAIFLTILGTFGLASFATLRRQKEVAVRKVLGASRIRIMNLLAKEFLILVVVSVAIAYPLTYWLVGDWLANFNERIDQAMWVYLIAALSVAAITWLTVASIAFKAASTRPSLILRDE
ncbi:ABC transporter permease [Pseudoalteromonas porphyrae]|uniref:ABC transporter permease n=1 Tax=Pseudoalteromonas porphyrae TaxID=187330 RepID=A0A0N1EXC8_9GAMM|nr:ABC transporter permease [Pseudoalteromonas porphyrae]KPH63080.1 ABC transporter permease [Pseudoalteromonas porphyrae]